MISTVAFAFNTFSLLGVDKVSHLSAGKSGGLVRAVAGEAKWEEIFKQHGGQSVETGVVGRGWCCSNRVGLLVRRGRNDLCGEWENWLKRCLYGLRMILV